MLDWLFTHTPLVYLSQSLWRDEAFSVLAAEHSFTDIIKLSAGDYTPPLYYVLLKIWMLFFGREEEAIRSLSFIFYALTVWVGYKFAREIVPSNTKWFASVTTVLLAINPMLLYYAFEARTYSLVAFLTMCSFYFFMKQRWKWYIAAATLALYAHPYTLLAFVAQGLYVICWKRPILKTFTKKALIIAAFYLPWILVILMQIMRSAEMWYYPVTKELVRAITGSMFLGFEGTPDRLWDWCVKLSVILLSVITFGYFNGKIKNVQRLFLVSFILPLAVVIGISFIKPIFTQRYLVFAVISEIFLVSLGLFSIPNRSVKVCATAGILGFLLFFNTWYPSQNTKQDFQTPFMEINSMMEKDDIILNESALTFFNAEYYATYPEQVYLLREDGSPLPSYVGSVLIPREKWLMEMPENTKVFLLHEDGTYETITY